MFYLFTLDQSYEHYLDLFRLDNVLLVHTWSILWTLFWLVQTRQCFICSHLINLMNIIWTCSDWTMFCWFTLDQSYEHYLDLFRLDNVLLVQTLDDSMNIIWTLCCLMPCPYVMWFINNSFDLLRPNAIDRNCFDLFRLNQIPQDLCRLVQTQYKCT